MKVAITGLAGFIGSTLAKQLKNNGHDVVGFDNYNDYYDVNLKHKRANILKSEYDITVNNIDLMDSRGLTDFFVYEKPDMVVHLAAYAGVRHSMEAPMKYVMNNIVGSQNLIQAMEAANVNNVIFASTSCTMHGNPLPWNEQEKLGPQLNPYGYSKSCNENQFFTSNIENTIGLRFFTVYGPWGRPDMALFDFTRAIMADETIKVFNFGDMKRDFTYVDDIVNGIEIVMNNMTNRDIYNIGYGEQVQLMDFISEIEKNLGKEAKKDFVAQHPADAKETWSDTTKLQKLGYKPTTPISVGVKNFIDWYKGFYI